jgi:hypothetical protein
VVSSAAPRAAERNIAEPGVMANLWPGAPIKENGR